MYKIKVMLNMLHTHISQYMGLLDLILLDYREGRKGIDLVNDHPENSLMREVDTIKSCQDKMRRTLEQVQLTCILELHIIQCAFLPDRSTTNWVLTETPATKLKEIWPIRTLQLALVSFYSRN